MRVESLTHNQVLQDWNNLDATTAAAAVLPCCGSRRWADRLAQQRPFSSVDEMLHAASEIWQSLEIGDWDEAFQSHPRIGESMPSRSATQKSAQWSKEEQAMASLATSSALERLREGNAEYESRFGRIYIVCASGKSMEELLAILSQRLKNNEQEELIEAVEQQRRITEIRLKKWLQL